MWDKRYYFNCEGKIIAVRKRGKRSRVKDWVCCCYATTRDEARKIFIEWAIKWWAYQEKKFYKKQRL